MRGRVLTDRETKRVRGRLVRIALRLVEREGRAACSLRRVGAAAEMSRMTPYSYFPKKEALLDATRVAALQALCDACERALATAHDVTAKLAAVGHAYVHFALSRPALYDLIVEAHAGGPEHAAAVARYRSLAESPLRDAYAQGMIALEPARLGHVLWAATHGLVALHRAGKLDHGIEFETVLRDLGDTLAFGFVPRSAP
jgi:AcrR family transcriptional regulator